MLYTVDCASCKQWVSEDHTMRVRGVGLLCRRCLGRAILVWNLKGYEDPAED